jgi:hypothetical protein
MVMAWRLKAEIVWSQRRLSLLGNGWLNTFRVLRCQRIHARCWARVIKRRAVYQTRELCVRQSQLRSRESRTRSRHGKELGFSCEVLTDVEDFMRCSYSNLSVTVVERSKACTVFARSEAGIMGSNPTQSMHVSCLCVYVRFSVFVYR